MNASLFNKSKELSDGYEFEKYADIVAKYPNAPTSYDSNTPGHFNGNIKLIDLIDIESYTYFYNKTCEHINELILLDSFNSLHIKHNYIVSNINLFFHEHIENNPNIHSSILIKYFFNLLNLSYIPLLDRTDYINTLFNHIIIIIVTSILMFVLLIFIKEYFATSPTTM